MAYSEDFKAKVKKTYPAWEEMHQLLDDGDLETVGKGLYDSSMKFFTPEEIVQAVESLNFLSIYQKAKDLIGKKALYQEWEEIKKTQKKPMGM
ncbi:MAG: hypothetical protein HFH09_02910 [Bacilli bacterium]|nr:hypothetical protein [Bacilli bacterium]